MTWIHGAVSMDKPVAIVPFAQEFCSVKNIQLVKKKRHIYRFTREVIYLYIFLKIH